MVPIFNVSSPGASATAWLTRLLNLHSGVVCLHALRDDPFYGRSITPERMVEGLLDMHRRTKSMRSFGVVHSFYDARHYELVKGAGGGFMAMARHPVARIHSLFEHAYRDVEGLTIRDRDVYGTIAADDRVDVCLPLFEQHVTSTLYADLLNLTTAPADEVALFERFVADPAYCRARLEVLLDEDLAPLAPAIEQAQRDPVNRHAEQRLAVAEIYARWPQPYRDVFHKHAVTIGLHSVRDVYGHYGYDVAPMLAA